MEKNRRYFKSLEELSDNAAVESKEFLPNTPGKNIVEESDFNLKSSRRDFLKFMGFGVSAATLAACTKTPIKKAIPYVVKPNEVDPGVPNYYASYFPDGEFGIVVKTREGRPIKIDGNELCPISNGGTSATAQASVLSLYDDGRLKEPLKNGVAADWKEVDKDIYKALRGTTAKGGKIAILANTINSPSTLRAIEDFIKTHPTTKLVQYDAVSYNGIAKAHKQVFGKNVIPSFEFKKAKTIVSFSADFLGTWLSPVEFSKGYAINRDATTGVDMSYHVQFESSLSLAGGKADLRIPIKPSEQGVALVALYNAIAKKAGKSSIGSVSYDQLNKHIDENKIKHIADELWKTKGQSLVICGSNDTEEQVITAEINNLLSNYGNTLSYEKPSYQKKGDDAAMNQLVADMNAERIDTLIIYGANPAYNYADADKFIEGIKKVKLSISLNSRLDETSLLTNYVCPNSHFLESWNDHNPKYGIYALSQPTISTIFNTRQAQESLLKWSGNGSTSFYDYIRNTWSSTISKHQSEYDNFEDFWMHSLHDGVFKAQMNHTGRSLNIANAVTAASAGAIATNGVETTTDTLVTETVTNEKTGLLKAVKGVAKGDLKLKQAVKDVIKGKDIIETNTEIVETVSDGSVINHSNNNHIAQASAATIVSSYIPSSVDLNSVAKSLTTKMRSASGMELNLYQKVCLLEGNDGNNPWLHEMPDAVSKVSWDNYLCVSPIYAKENGFVDGDLVSISLDGKTLENVPVLLMPGQKAETVSLALGYGHKMDESAGKVANTVGVNAFKLIQNKSYFNYSASNITITKTGSGYNLAKTQTHHHIQIPNSPTRKDDIIKEVSLESLAAYRSHTHDDHAEEDGHGGHGKKDNGKVYDGAEPDKYKDLSLYPDWRDRNYYKAIHWGLTVNLNTCVGCNACAIACQAENNVPVVGKEEVFRRREMHWIRIDRYFATANVEDQRTTEAILDTENPSMSFQPLMCQHCDNAPCENVCPVNAINHSSEGINQQIYNRCMGTRYCANNCPYKVRRFNWFAYYDNDQFNYHLNSDLGRMVLNPDVTVRARGVMEKCSFCMQRIQSAKLVAKTENRSLKDGDVKTACQDACPTGAIQFGNMNDPKSKVSKVIKGDLTYRLVELLNTQNSVYYTTLVKNTKLDSEFASTTTEAHTHTEEEHH